MPQVLPRFALLILSCCLASRLMAGEGRVGAVAEQEQFAGALIDHTITVAGHEFFKQFSMLWREQPLNERYLLTIHEQPSARRGTSVWIEYDRVRVFQAYLPANRTKLGELVREANEACYRNVIDAEVRKLLFRETDFARDEI